MTTKTLPDKSSTSRLDFLFKPMPAYGLGIFRIWFGIIMLWEMFYLVRLDFVEIFLNGPDVHFTYDILPFLRPLPTTMMWGLIAILIVACVLIIIGKWYKPAVAVFAIGFTYIFFLDKAYYNNHLYLVCLLSTWLVFIEADKVLAVGKGKTTETTVPAWMYYILQAQLFIVYFFGGIAKINGDWLMFQEPVRTLIADNGFLTVILGKEAAVYFLTIGGLIFDLAIGFLLLIPKTRKIAITGVLFFNIMNAIMFDDINIFPYFMIGATVIFLDQNWVKKTVLGFLNQKVDKKQKQRQKKAKNAQFLYSQKLVVIMAVYLAIQVLLPFRGHLFPGNIDWNGEGQRFSWRMKIQTRNTKELTFQLMDYDKKTLYPVDLNAYNLNLDQVTMLSMDPFAVWQLVQFLKERGEQKLTSQKIGVRANIVVSMNGRPFQNMVDPEQDLGEVDRTPFSHSEWILPLVERN